MDWAFTLPSWHSVIDICIMLCRHDRVNAQSVARHLLAYRHISWGSIRRRYLPLLGTLLLYHFVLMSHYSQLYPYPRIHHTSPDIHSAFHLSRHFPTGATSPRTCRRLPVTPSLSLTHYEQTRYTTSTPQKCNDSTPISTSSAIGEVVDYNLPYRRNMTSTWHMSHRIAPTTPDPRTWPT